MPKTNIQIRALGIIPNKLEKTLRKVEIRGIIRLQTAEIN